MNWLVPGAPNSLLSINAAGIPEWKTASTLGYWALNGNAGTDDATSFLGTTDAEALVLGANSQRMLILDGVTQAIQRTQHGNPRGIGAVDLQARNSADPANAVAGGAHSFIGGGRLNVIFEPVPGFSMGASVTGGIGNTIDHGLAGAIVGGSNNLITDSQYGFIGGGIGNSIDAVTAAILGGQDNEIFGANWGVIAGGRANSASSDYAVVAGGEENYSSGQHAFIGSGRGNIVQDDFSSIVGGQNNETEGNYAVIGGGMGNFVNGTASIISGGSANRIVGSNSTVLGGNSMQLGSGQMGFRRPDDVNTLSAETSADWSTTDNGVIFTNAHLALANDGANAPSEIRFYEQSGNGTNRTSFKAANDMTTDVNYTLPYEQGAFGTVLTNDGAGNLQWQKPLMPGYAFFAPIVNDYTVTEDDNVIAYVGFNGDVDITLPDHDDVFGRILRIANLSNGGTIRFKNPDGTNAVIYLRRLNAGSSASDWETTNVLRGDFSTSFGDGAGKYVGPYITIIATGIGWYVIGH